MSHLDPTESHEVVKKEVVSAIKEQFPYEGRTNVLDIKDIEVDDNVSSDDVGYQSDAKMSGRTFGIPVNATVSLKDKKTRKVIDEKKMKVADIPKITNRLSYIVDGSEYQVDNQWRLQPGIYSKVRQDGGLETFFNIKGKPLRMKFDPKSRKFNVKHGGAEPPLYPLMKAMDFSDADLEKMWGKDILEANKVDNRGRRLNVEKKAIEFANRLDSDKSVKDIASASAVIKDSLSRSELNSESTKKTLGKSFNSITPEVVGRASDKLLGIARGEKSPDVKDSLQFKDLYGVEDFVAERIRKSNYSFRKKIGNNLDRKDRVRDIVSTGMYSKPIKDFFGKSALSSTTPQTNPLRMVSGHTSTTVTGEGGIENEQQLRGEEDVKLVDPSHFGVLDPLHTPEGAKTGVNLQLSLGVKKRGHKATVPLINKRTGKTEYVDVSRINDSVVALPDSVKREKGEWKPKKGNKVKVSAKDNNITEESIDKVDYIIPRAAQMFSMATNQVPFLSSDSPNRATMSGRHQEQAIPLKYAEKPLVRSALGDVSFSSLMGKFSAQHSPVEGEISEVKEDEISIKERDGKTRKIQTYNHYPTNDKKGQIHSTPRVKPGDKVKRGDLLADTTFTRDGEYTPGVNLKYGFTPYHGLTYEDGIVISESASNKLTSNHLHKLSVSERDAKQESKNRFHAMFNDVKPEKLSKLKDDGVVELGQVVNPGDVLVAASADRKLTKEQKKLSQIHKSIVNPKQDKSIVWEEDVPGKVVAIHKKGGKTEVHVETEEKMEVADKLSTNHASKGVITSILPDHEMPHTKDGEPMEVLFNPIGIAGRMNTGLVLEAAASKVAEKRGKPYTVNNFEDDNNYKSVKDSLKKEGLLDTDTLIDPRTGKEIKDVLTGKEYTYKLEHQVGKKLSARERGAYDYNQVPKGGGKEGAQAFGQLGIYSMLANGARANLRETQTWLSDKAQGEGKDEFWAALQSGELLPPPQETFALNKFKSYLKTMGVDMKQTGNSLNLLPLTDDAVKKLSNGKLKDAGRMVTIKNNEMVPEKGGLFDEKIVGGLEGKNWSHIELSERMPNPIFEGAIKNILKVRGPEFGRIIDGTAGVKDGKIVEGNTEGAIKGPKALSSMLEKIDVDSELKKEEERLRNVSHQEKDESRKRVKYLRALKKSGLSPKEAYTTKNIPVMPPSMRPVALMEDGAIQNDDLNELYKGTALVNDGLNKLKKSKVQPPESALLEKESSLYDRVKSLHGLGGSVNDKYPGIMQVVAGKHGPKSSYAQDVLIKRKRDLSGRSTITPDPSLSLDEAGIPREMARKIYKPFIVRELRNTMNIGGLEAKKMVDEDHDIAKKALEKVVKDRPVILKRDPALHKFSTQAFKPKLKEGKDISIPSMVCSGFNADFDGDTMSAYVPVSEEAREESFDMFPSNNLFSPATGKLMYAPTHEMQVGLYNATEVGKDSNRSFKNMKELTRAVGKGEVKDTDIVNVGSTRTTYNRMKLDQTLPEPMRGGRYLTDLDYRLTKKDQGQLFDQVSRSTDKKDASNRINELKNLGNQIVTSSGFSFNMKDFEPYSDLRKSAVNKAESKLKGVDRTTKKGQQKVVDAYEEAMIELEKGVQDKAKKNANKSSLAKLQVAAGIKGNGYRQLTAAPVLFVDGKGDVVPTPVMKSYMEGMDSSDYWSATSGGRKGIVQKVQSVSTPGHFTKMMTNSVVDTIVDADDCETEHGITLPIDEPDVNGRFLKNDVKLSNGDMIPKETLLDQDVINKIRNDKGNDKIVVRSPMRCTHTNGICARCAGADENGRPIQKGTNLGIIAAQSLGERGTQMAMKSFHSGGVYEGKEAQQKSITGGGLDRALTLLNLPKNVKGSATLAEGSGEVKRVEKDPAGGYNVDIEVPRGKDSKVTKKHYVPNDVELRVGQGQKVRAGDPISSGPVNPHQLLPIAGIAKVQGHLANELNNIYGPQGIKRRHSEILTKAVTGVAEIEDPGDNEEYVRGDYADSMYAADWNARNKNKRSIKYRPVLRGVEQIPTDANEDFLARLNHERLKNTVIEASQQSWSSDIHGRNPIPSLIHGVEFGKGKKGGEHLY